MADASLFNVTTEAGVTVVTLTTECAHIDESIVDTLNRRLMDLATSLKTPAIVLDLSAVEFFGSSFIETMFRLWKRLQSQGSARFAVCGLNHNCREVLEVTHLDQLWTVRTTRAEALTALAIQK